MKSYHIQIVKKFCKNLSMASNFADESDEDYERREYESQEEETIQEGSLKAFLDIEVPTEKQLYNYIGVQSSSIRHRRIWLCQARRC